MKLSEKAKEGLYALIAFFVVFAITFIIEGPSFSSTLELSDALGDATFKGIAASILVSGFISGRRSIRKFIEKRKKKKSKSQRKGKY